MPKKYFLFGTIFAAAAILAVCGQSLPFCQGGFFCFRHINVKISEKAAVVQKQ